MKSVLVIGAGVIGVTTAHYLNKLGLKVTVIDSLHKSAMSTSFANAGQLSYSYAFPWASPGIALKALKWSMDKSSPLRIKPDWKNLEDQATWLLRMLANSSSKSYSLNKKSMLEISALSKQAMAELLSTKVVQASDFDWQSKGTLQVFRNQAQLEAGLNDLQILHSSGVAATFITNQDILIEKEPNLKEAIQSGKVLGGIFLPEDETGDCHLFTNKLTECLKKNGVRFLFDLSVVGSNVVENRTEVLVNLEDNLKGRTFYEKFDIVVVCTGVKAPSTLKLLQANRTLKGKTVDCPIYPVKGYSMTFESNQGPSSTIMDEKYKIAITKLGNRVRMGGVAEVAGFNRELDEFRRTQFIAVFEDLFGESAAARNGTFWTGLRPSTPSSVPMIGEVEGVRGVFINAGHGTLGWTMACGSGLLLSQSVKEIYKL